MMIKQENVIKIKQKQKTINKKIQDSNNLYYAKKVKTKKNNI